MAIIGVLLRQNTNGLPLGSNCGSAEKSDALDKEVLDGSLYSLKKVLDEEIIGASHSDLDDAKCY